MTHELKWSVKTDSFHQEGTCSELNHEIHLRCSGLHGTLESVTALLKIPVTPDTRIFMNGYQTWTWCREQKLDGKTRGVNRIPSFLLKKYAFDRYGDYHFTDYPYRNGFHQGESWCYFRNGDQYLLIASTSEEGGYTQFFYEEQNGTLRIERDCAGVEADEAYPLLDLYLAEGKESEVFDGWMEAARIKPLPARKLYGYSSWYNRYQNITEPAIQNDLKGCRTIFEPGDLFQIDDGWEPYVGDWLNPDPRKFPGGMKAQADAIHTAGFKAGIWLAPFAAEEKSDLFQEHPDWILKHEGKPWKSGCNWSSFYGLDLDHPEVQNYLKEVFHQVFDEWGFDLVKLDFLYAAAPFGTLKESRAARMIRVMQFLRELCGSHPILGCGVPVMPAFGLTEYCRTSCDVSLDWDDVLYMRGFHRERNSTKHAIETNLARRQLNGRAFGSDPDVFFLRTENCRLTEAEKNLLATLDALTGTVFLTSDDPGSYTEAMKQKYREYRHMTEAKVESVSLDSGITITYVLDGVRHVFHS